MMLLAAQVRLKCQELSREAFLRRYPHPWLLRELTDAERSSISFDRFGESVTHPTSPLSHGSRPLVAPTRIAARLHQEPYRFGLLPVAKARMSPWKDRVVVGRTASCDLVLSELSVSKVHAYFLRNGEGLWRVHDARGMNGTVVDGRRVDPAGEGQALESGAQLQFGRQRCEFLDGGELFDILVGDAT
jgi:hypothetical protein